MEPLLNGKAQYIWPPRTDQLNHVGPFYEWAVSDLDP
jgi:hypothetical protein